LNQKFFSREGWDLRIRLENAVGSYEALIKSSNPEEFDHISSKNQLRQFAIAREAYDRLSLQYAASMFIESATLSTRTEPHLLKSWICNKGAGPIRILPELTRVEKEYIRRQGKSLVIKDNLPTDPKLLIKMWEEQAEGVSLFRNDAVFVSFFSKLPVPYGLLRDYERDESYINKLDNVWRVLDVTRSGQRETLLAMDLKKFVASQGASSVFSGERIYQRYQEFELWCRLVVPCLPEVYRRLPETDSGIKLFSYIASEWRVGNIYGDDEDDDENNDFLTFTLDPNVFEIIRVAKDIENDLAKLRQDDSKINRWIKKSELAEIKRNVDGEIHLKYAKMIRRGFQQFLGPKHVMVRSNKKHGTVSVKIINLRRMIRLACIRRINLEFTSVIRFKLDKSLYTENLRCHSLAGLVPSDEELVNICGL
jgi:hypothetical protein